jgi:hypothetical protein
VPVMLSARITNNGKLSTGVGFTDLFEINKDAPPAGGLFANIQVKIATTTVALTPNQTKTQFLKYTFPSAGAWYVRLCADTNASNVGIIDESNPDDNCSPNWTKVEVTNPPVACTPPVGSACQAAIANNCGVKDSVVNALCACPSPPDTACTDASVPMANISAKPSLVKKGQASAIAWSAKNVNSCSVTKAAGGAVTSLATGLLPDSGGGISNYIYDYNNDGKVTASGVGGYDASDNTTDSAFLLQVASGLTTCPTGKTCDVNGTSGVTASDASALTTLVSKKDPKLNLGQSETINSQTKYVLTCSYTNSVGSGTKIASTTVNISPIFEPF